MPRKEPKHSRKKTVIKEKPIFGKDNYQLMGAGAGLVFVGFAIMAFENQIDGFLSLFISPLLVIAGFIAFGFGIIRKQAEPESTSGSSGSI